MNVKLHLGAEPLSGTELHLEVELHLGAELQNEENAHSNSKISTHGRDVETPDKDAQSDTEAERQSVRSRIEPVLSKYVRRHHPTNQIIGDKDARPMKRRRSRSDACLVSMLEPKIVKDALDNENWIQAMNEIDQIKKNKT